VLNIGGFFALLFAAAYRLPGGVAAAVGAIQPLIAVGLAAVLLRERPNAVTVAAVVVGAIGVVVLVTRSSATLNVTGLVFAFAGACSMATGVVLTKHWKRPNMPDGRPVSMFAFTSWQLTAGGLFLLPVMLLAEGAPPSLTTRNALGYLWLTSIGTAVAYSLWFRGIGLLPVVATTVLGTLSPVVAALLGWLILDQTLSAAQIIGALTAVGAVVVAQLSITRSVHPGPGVNPQGSTANDEGALPIDSAEDHSAR
jgi:probable blue pigment (indigoidine) exporter